MDGNFDWHGARALLEWQLELGVVDAIGDTPVDRYALEARPAAGSAKPAERPATGAAGVTGAAAAAPAPEPKADPVAEARAAAAGAATLEDLRAALGAFEHCELKRGARNLVFADGTAGARVMIVGEAPGREEDIEGRPFVGRAGQLLDRMLAAIGLSRAENAYITNVLPWRPPQNRDPRPEEIAMMKPFLERHIALAAPDVLVLMGNIACHALLGRKGITRLRGQWQAVMDKPAMPMLHPAYLLRNPGAKREAWADLLDLSERLERGA